MYHKKRNYKIYFLKTAVERVALGKLSDDKIKTRGLVFFLSILDFNAILSVQLKLETLL